MLWPVLGNSEGDIDSLWGFLLEVESLGFGDWMNIHKRESWKRR